MECPKCGHQQPDGLLECQRCSVIFAKLRAMEEREAQYQEASYESQGPAYGGYQGHVPPEYEASQRVETDDDENPAWAKHPLAFFALAVLFAWGAMDYYQDLTNMELEDGTLEIHWLFAFLYNTFGKWGVVLPFVGLCGVMVVGGLQAIIARFT